MKIAGILLLVVLISCNTEKPGTQDTGKQGTYKNNPNKQKNPNKQRTATASQTTAANASDTSCNCCDPLLEIDPKLLIRDKNK